MRANIAIVQVSAESAFTDINDAMIVLHLRSTDSNRSSDQDDHLALLH